MTAKTADLAAEITFEGARAPDRRTPLDVGGLSVSRVEWGDPQAPPLLLAHGGADFAQTFDVFAPLLAAGGGYRVISWDHRGHGDSDRADLYTWAADMRDAYFVLESIGRDPIPAVGHSKGAGLLSNLCAALPERFTHFVNIDGVPSKRSGRTKRPLEERIAARAKWHENFLDTRRSLLGRERRPGTLQELAERRARQNPRSSMEWLLYLASVGAFQSDDGWRWKLDPLIRMFTPGPWRPEWGLEGLRELRVPMLAILGKVREPMGWGTDPDQVAPYLPGHAHLEVFDDTGHFVHIEHPRRTAKLVLEYLSS
jgi:pimeloyl-ACP methyl ester carboxylesterase